MAYKGLLQIPPHEVLKLSRSCKDFKGTFHTHPIPLPLPTPSDILSAHIRRSKIEIVGTRYGNKLIFLTLIPRNNNYENQIKFLPLPSMEELLNIMNNFIRTLLKHVNISINIE